jgi:hypothetical protein
MPRLYPEPLLFCLAWAALAIWGATASIWIGILLSGGLAVVLMPLSATIISKRDDPALERQVRWGLLVLAATALFAYRLIQSSSSS